MNSIPLISLKESPCNSRILYTYEKPLSEKENQILSLVYSDNSHYLNAFNFVHKFYRINYRLYKSNNLAVFKAVYIEKSKLPA